MRTIVTTLFLTLFMIAGVFAGDKQELAWKSLEDGITEAKKSNKKIMIDFYTNWCGWCKKLDKEVYGEPKVSDYLQSQYVIIKINAEAQDKVTFKGKKYTLQQLAASFGVSGYPTIVFLKPDSEGITSLGGYVEAERFLKILKFLGEDHYTKMSWEDYLAKDSSGEKKD